MVGTSVKPWFPNPEKKKLKKNLEIKKILLNFVKQIRKSPETFFEKLDYPFRKSFVRLFDK